MRIARGVALIMVASYAGASVSAQNPPAPGDGLVGLWGSETTSGPRVRGELTLERGPQQWMASVGGYHVTAPLTGDSIRIVLPGGEGELRSRIDSGGVVRGFWVQPPVYGSPYATPVVLQRVHQRAWRGTVAPLEGRFSLYLLIRRDGDGSLQGVFRNPEMNWTGGAPWFRVTRQRDSISFVDPTTGKPSFVQPYDSAQRRISMEVGGPISLTPLSLDEAAGFLPRSPAESSQHYRAPLRREDGWRTGRAKAVGMDEARLAQLVERIATTDPTGKGAPLIHSVLVARRGRLVLEEYFFGYSAERLHDLRSASKTFTSVMAGAAMQAGAPITMTTPVTSVFRGRGTGLAHDPRKDRITMGNLLTHSSGLACDENDSESPGNEGTMQQQTRQPDWYRYVLDLPMAHDPGTTYAYCSGGMNLAGGMIARTTEMWLPDFFDRYVARPLGIDRYAMNLMPTGEAYAGGGVYLRPRDLLKFGQAYLDGGTWNGKRVVTVPWAKESTAPQIRTPDGASDGYGWHRHELQLAGKSYPSYEANGNGGQFLIVVPELDLAVVFTAGNYNQYPIWRKFRDELVPQYIMAALLR